MEPIPLRDIPPSQDRPTPVGGSDLERLVRAHDGSRAVPPRTHRTTGYADLHVESGATGGLPASALDVRTPTGGQATSGTRARRMAPHPFVRSACSGTSRLPSGARKEEGPSNPSPRRESCGPAEEVSHDVVGPRARRMEPHPFARCARLGTSRLPSGARIGEEGARQGVRFLDRSSQPGPV